MKTFTIRVEKQVTQEQIDYLLAAALEGGINYWCSSAEISNAPKEPSKYMSEVITRGGTIAITDSEDDNVYELKEKNLLEALGKLNIDFEQYDALDADEVIQTAIFGEVIYA